MKISVDNYREIRAYQTDNTVRVYQAYSDIIADAALSNNRFVSPPFKMERMTWIKPSFLWMMYRSGWGKKDEGQKRILAIDLSKEGFEQALLSGCISHYELGSEETQEEWTNRMHRAEVIIQWDPERDLLLAPLKHRSLQIGLRGSEVQNYIFKWTQKITEVTLLANEIHELVLKNQVDKAKELLPVEQIYPLKEIIRKSICAFN